MKIEELFSFENLFDHDSNQLCIKPIIDKKDELRQRNRYASIIMFSMNQPQSKVQTKQFPSRGGFQGDRGRGRGTGKFSGKSESKQNFTVYMVRTKYGHHPR